MRHIFLRMAVGVWLASAAAASHAKTNYWLGLVAPDASQEFSEAGLPPPTDSKPWYALSIEARAVNVTPVTTTRQPTAALSFGALMGPDSDAPPPPAPPERYTVPLPAGAAFAFWLTDEAPAIQPGRFESALAAPVTLDPRMLEPVDVADRTWALVTRFIARPDGKPLEGSLSLFARNVFGEELMLVPPAIGMAFESQQIVWVGRLTARSKVDVLVRRTWLTGEVDYVLSVDGAVSVLTIDPEHPTTAFSSGAGNSMSVETPPGQTHGADETLARSVSVTIDESEWNPAYEKAAAAGVPARMLERTLTFHDAPVRLSIEHLPMWTEPADGSESNASFWLGTAQVKVSYDGKTQMLISLPLLNDGAFTFRIGTIGDEVAIEIVHWPHYNNEITYRWVRRAEDGRFLRTYVYLSQGC